MNGVIALKKAKQYTDETADSLGSLKGAPCTIKSTTETDEGTIIVFEWKGTSGATQTSSILVKNGKDGQAQTITTSRTADNDGVIITVVNPDGTTASTATVYDGDSGQATSIDWSKVENKPFITLSADDFDVDENGVLTVVASGEGNKIESISVNGENVEIDENKNVDITIPNEYDDTALSDRVTANEEAIATLNGTGEGSVSKTVDDALNKFATDISDDGVVNTYKELVDYAASHSSDIAEMVTDIADNATAIEELNTKVTDLETSVEGVYTKDETDELIKDELYTEVTTPAHYELSSIGVDGALEIVADGTATDGQIDISNVTDITVNIGDYVIFVDESTTYTEKYVSKVEGKGLSTNDLTDEIVEKIENTYSKDETYSRTEIDEKITESQTGMDVYSTDDWDSFYSALSIDATTI